MIMIPSRPYNFSISVYAVDLSINQNVIPTLGVLMIHKQCCDQYFHVSLFSGLMYISETQIIVISCGSSKCT